MLKSLLNLTLARYLSKDFQITISNYSKEDNFFNISFTDEVGRTLYTTWSKSTGFLNCTGSASYITLAKLHKIEKEVDEMLGR